MRFVRNDKVFLTNKWTTIDQSLIGKTVLEGFLCFKITFNFLTLLFPKVFSLETNFLVFLKTQITFLVSKAYGIEFFFWELENDVIGTSRFGLGLILPLNL